ncbi:MAG: HEAT repeat domain-containing protein [Candidatus Methanoperedens sp.]|nr:HEAT repeat domain-containing protein [Candidatus Methanoperedens sp.]
MTNENESVREGAADALVRIGGSVVGPLIAALKDKNEVIRKGAAEILGKLGETQEK